jgi:hypothetical protein
MTDVDPPDDQDEQAEAEALDADKTGSSDSDYPDNYPLDRSVAVEDYGTTADEEETGESLRRRVAREVPDVDQVGGTGGVGVDSDIGSELAEADDDPADGELLGELDDDPGVTTGEESAVHIVDELPGDRA